MGTPVCRGRGGPLLVLGWALAIAPCVGVATGAAGVPDDSVSVIDCWRIARERAPDVVISALEQVAARSDSMAASRNRRPRIAFFGGATLAPEWSYDPVITNLGEYSLKAGIELPLLDGGERARERTRAATDAMLSASELERARREAGLRAAGLAIEILRLHERQGSLRESVEWVERLASLLKSGAYGGSRSISDARRVELENDAAREELESIDADLAVDERDLAQLLGRSLSSPPAVRLPNASEDVPPSSSDSVSVLDRVAALPEVESARLRESQARLDLDEAKRKNALRVDGSLDAGLAGADLTHAVPPDLTAQDPHADFSDRLRRDLGASASVEFRQPVADASAGPRVAARGAGLDAATSRLAAETETQRRVNLDLLARWRAAATRLGLAQRAVDGAEDHVLRMKSLYAAGAFSLLEVLDARRVLDDARERLANSRAEVRAARVAVEARK